jgi:hypothetical protein
MICEWYFYLTKRKDYFIMKNKKTLRGITIYSYIELEINALNKILEKAGCLNAKAFYKHEEKSENCKFSCIAEDDVTPFSITLGGALGINIRSISWVCDYAVSIIFD